MRKYLLLIATFIFACHSVQAQQTILEQFGQNRIQTRKIDWQYYDTAHFRVFYYDLGKYNAQYILQQAEMDFPKIVGEMGVRMPRKINIILYNSFTDYKQTNTGRYNEDLNLTNNAVLDISGSNVVIYFNGSHDDLRNQMKKGVASIIKDNLLFGFTPKEIVKNAIKLRLPLWYTSGYVQYESSPWDASKQSAIRSLLQSGSSKADFLHYAEQSPELVGHSFFNFIEKEYARSYINNLFYLTSNRKPIANSIEIVLKKRAREVYADWKAYYLRSETDEPSLGARSLLFTLKPKPGGTFSGFALSPDGTQMAYCENIGGTYEVKLYGTQDKRSVVILEGGLRQQLPLKDPSYPLMCWSADGKKLAIMYERDYMQRLKVYDAKRGRISDRIILPNKFDRLAGLSFMDDDDKLVISAIRKGQCDLYQYVIKSATLVNITKDIWDDLMPQYIKANGYQGVLFMSNRPKPDVQVKINNGELPNTNPNIFLYDDATGSPSLMQLTKEDRIKIIQPIQYGPKDFAFLAEIDGKYQRIIAHLVKTSARKDSFYYTISNPSNYSLLAHGYNNVKQICFDVIERNGNVEVYSAKYKTLSHYDDSLGYSADVKTHLSDFSRVRLIDTGSTPTTFFLSEFDNDIDLVPATKPQAKNANTTVTTATNPQAIRFKNRTYIPTFNTDFLQTTVDNTMIFDRYQNLNTSNGSLAVPPLGAMLRMSLIDFMEDYKLTGALRMPFVNNGSAYMLKFANYRRKIDWELQALYNKNILDQDLRRDTVNFSPFIERLNQIQTSIQASLNYPLSVTTSLRLYTGIRQDKKRYNVTSEYSARFDVSNEYWQFNRLEYVFDNSKLVLLNIRKGTRLKIYQDAYMRILGPNGNMFNSGIDVRHYQTLYKNAIFAIRVNSGHSFGTRPMLYKIGGVDNELVPSQYSVNTDYMLRDNTQYGWQSQAANLRGFGINARQGASFALVNAEVRVPIVNTFMRRSVRSRFFNSLQLVPFADVGTAGEVFLETPTGDTRTHIAQNRNAILTSRNGLSGTASGVGMGLRAVAGSYFLRLDVAKGSDSPRIYYHLSLSQDF